MRQIILAGLVTLVGCTSLEKQQSNEQAQIAMVKVQREAIEREEKTEAQEKAALYNAIAAIAQTNPEHSPAALVALTAISMNADSTEGDEGVPVYALRDKPNEALLWTQALAPTVGAVVNGLGVAMVGASVAKNSSDNSRDIQINDANTDAQIIASVADLGTAAVGIGGIQSAGDVYQVQDNGIIDQSTYSSADTTTTTTTSTDYNASDTAFINTGVNDHTDYIVDLDTTLNYDGSDVSLADLVASLRAAGAAYSITFNGVEVASGEGDGTTTTTTTIDCSGPQFSPQPPECN